MSLPTANDVQAVDPVLTNLLVGYMQADNRFIADRVFRPVSVDKDSGTYYIFTKKYWFLNEMKVRAYGGVYARGGFGVESTTYTTEQFALAVPIADETRANSQVPMDLEQAAIRWLSQQALLKKEIAFSAAAMVTGVWGTSATGTTKWSDFSSGDPVANVKTAMRTISNNTGYEANTLVCGSIVDDALTNHPDILDRLKYTSAATAANIVSALAAVLGLANYWVSKATYSNTNETASFSATAIVDDDALITYVTPTPGIFEVSGGYTFNWAPGGGMGGIRPLYRDNENDGDLVKFKMQWNQKIVASDLGYIYLDIVD